MATAFALAQFLQQDVFGTVYLSLAVQQTICLLCKRGIDEWLVKELPRAAEECAPGVARWALRRVGIGAVALGAGGYLALKLAASLDLASSNFFSAALLGVVAGGVLALTHTLQAVRRAIGDTKTSELPDLLIRPLVFLSLSAWFISAGGDLGPTAFLNSILVSTFAALFFACLLSREAFVRGAAFDVSSLREKGQIKYMFLGGASVALLPELLVILVASVSGEAVSGTFALGVKVASLMLLALSSFNLLIAPQISKMFSEEDYPGIEAISVRVALRSGLFALGTGLFLYAAHFASEGLLKPWHSVGLLVACVLSVGQIISAFSGPCSLLLTMTAYARENALVSLCATLSCLVVVAIFSRDDNVLLPALCMSAFVALRNIYCARIARRKLKIRVGLI
jgi:hypothetical protein